MLWGVVIEKGYRGRNWPTYRQAPTLDGCVRRCERGTTAFYADHSDRRPAFAKNDQKRTKVVKHAPLLRLRACLCGLSFLVILHWRQF